MNTDQGYGFFDEDDKTVIASEAQYILFVLENETFAVPLDSVREVIEKPTFKQVPNTVNYFLGYFNLRGEIVGLIDLRKKFGYKENETKYTTAIIFPCKTGSMAAMVDKIDQIATFSAKEIETNPKVKTKVAQEYLIGISKKQDRTAIFIDLKKVLSDDDWVKVKTLTT